MQQQVLRITDWALYHENHQTRHRRRLHLCGVPNRMDGEGYTWLMDHPAGAAHYGAFVVLLLIASRLRELPDPSRPIGFKAAGEAADESAAPSRAIRRATCAKKRADCAQVGAAFVPFRGMLLTDTGRPYTAEALARRSRVPVDVFDAVIPRLFEIEWLELLIVDEAGVIVDALTGDEATAAFARGTAQPARENAQVARENAVGKERNVKDAGARAPGKRSTTKVEPPAPLYVTGDSTTGDGSSEPFEGEQEPQLERIEADAIRDAAYKAFDDWSRQPLPIGRESELRTFNNEHREVMSLLGVLDQEPPINVENVLTPQTQLVTRAVGHMIRTGVNFKRIRFAATCVRNALSDWVVSGAPPIDGTTNATTRPAGRHEQTVQTFSSASASPFDLAKT